MISRDGALVCAPSGVVASAFNEPTEKELRAEAEFRMEAELREWQARYDAGFDHRTLKGTNLK